MLIGNEIKQQQLQARGGSFEEKTNGQRTQREGKKKDGRMREVSMREEQVFAAAIRVCRSTLLLLLCPLGMPGSFAARTTRSESTIFYITLRGGGGGGGGGFFKENASVAVSKKNFIYSTENKEATTGFFFSFCQGKI